MSQIQHELAQSQANIERLEKEIVASNDRPAAVHSDLAVEKRKQAEALDIAELRSDELVRSMHAAVQEKSSHKLAAPVAIHFSSRLGMRPEENSDPESFHAAMAAIPTPPLSPIPHAGGSQNGLREFFQPTAALFQRQTSSDRPDTPPREAPPAAVSATTSPAIRASAPSFSPFLSSSLSSSSLLRAPAPLHSFSSSASWELDQARQRTEEAKRRMQEMLDQTLPPSARKQQMYGDATAPHMMLFQSPAAVAAQVSATVPPHWMSTIASSNSSRFQPLPSAFRDSLRRSDGRQ